MRSIYLDYCTSTPIAASVRESMLPFLGEFYGHPSSDHWYGRAAQEAIEDSRSNLAAMLGCHPSEVIFTSGGTESVNIALLGVARAIGRAVSEGETPRILVSALEHECVRQCAKQLESEGWQVDEIGCDEQGVIRLTELEDAIQPTTRLASVIHASHRIGTIQPIAEIAEICRQRDVLLHTDAAQSVGKIQTTVDDLGVDLLTLTGHKFYAPKGIGALYVRTGVPVEPIMYGEGSEAGMRPGTANVPHIVALGQAAKLAHAGLESAIQQTGDYRDRFHSQLERAIGRDLRVHGAQAERLPGLLSLELPGVVAEKIHNMLPEICFAPCVPANGAKPQTACNRTHAALGLSHEASVSTLRVAFGWTTSIDEIHQAAQMIAAAYESLTS